MNEKYKAAWFMIISISVILLVNIVIVVFFMFIDFKLITIKFCRRFKNLLIPNTKKVVYGVPIIPKQP